MKDYYSILQIKPEATKEEIKVAYRKLAKKYHPDVNGGAQWAEERFKELQEAYSVLSDYFEKAEYDRKYAAYYKRKAGTTPRYSSVGNTPRSQATSPNRSTPPKPSTPPKQASGSKPYDTAQAKKSFEDYVKDNPRKAKAFSHWMNFDRSSKNSIYDGIKSDKKLNFKFANKVAAWFRLLIVFGEVFGITALIVIYLMDGQQQLEQVLGTKLTFNSHASNAEFAYWIDDASGVTHSRKCPKYNVGKGHGSNTATSKRCDCSYCRLETTSAGKNHRERSSFSAREADDNRTQNEAEQATAHEASRATSSSSKNTHSDASSTSSNISSPYSPPIPSISTYPSTNKGAKYSYSSSSMNTSSLRTGAGRCGKAFDNSRREHVGREKLQQSQSNKQDGSIASSSGYKTSAVSDYISSYRPHDSSHSDSHSPVSSETSTEAAPQTQTEHTAIPDSERITDSDWECTDGCEQEDFWITEEDDTTHNSRCSRYGKGEGMYAVQGSGTDCTVCGGAN